jgi:SAM-dependent methyltransferase
VAKSPTGNLDQATVAGFGREWAEYDQTPLSPGELQWMFDAYFHIFPFAALPPNAEGFDLGCGSGRWADLVLPKVGVLHCIDPSQQALQVARRRLEGKPRAKFHNASADDMPLAAGSQDFGYSLGVLHHVPDTQRALEKCVGKLRPGAPFLVYLYYRFDNRPAWFRVVWKGSDLVRRGVSRLPFPLRKTVATSIAATVYWPLARLAKFAEQRGRDVEHYPLSTYRNVSFYTMRTDALDRFGTRLEHRFTRTEIEQMMTAAGLSDILFSDQPPYWVACGRKT